MKIRDSSVSLDKTDLEILKALQNDSRETYSALGKRLGIAHSTVYDRVKRMEQQGVIKRYTAIVDAEKVGVRSVLAVMTVYVDPKEVEKLIIARVTAASQQDLHEFIADSVAPLLGVLRIRTSIVSKKFKETETQVLNDQS
jgi:DNA-binding Lrp family transcriptional regulator